MAPGPRLPAASCGALLFHDPGADASGDPIDTWHAVLASRSFRASLAGQPADARLDVRRLEASAVLTMRAWAPTPEAAASLCSAALQGGVARAATGNEQRKKALADAADGLRAQIAKVENAMFDSDRDHFSLVPAEVRLAHLEEQIGALDGADPRAQKRIDALRKEATEVAMHAFEWQRLRAPLDPLVDELRRVMQERIALEQRQGDELTVLDACGPCEPGVP